MIRSSHEVVTMRKVLGEMLPGCSDSRIGINVMWTHHDVMLRKLPLVVILKVQKSNKSLGAFVIVNYL